MIRSGKIDTDTQCDPVWKVHRGKHAALRKVNVAYVVVALAVMVTNGKSRQIFVRVFVCSCFSSANVTECAFDLVKFGKFLVVLCLLQNQTLRVTMQRVAMSSWRCALAM